MKHDTVILTNVVADAHAAEAERWARIAVTAHELAARIPIPPEPLFVFNSIVGQREIDARNRALSKRARGFRSAAYAERVAMRFVALVA